MTTTAMTNTQLLQCHNKALLTGIEGQRRFLLEMALAPMPCPVCGKAVNRIEAFGKTLDEYPVANAGDDGYACPECKTDLHFCLPLVGGGYWMTLRAWKGMNTEGK